MYKVLIVEDEIPAARRLKQLLANITIDIEILEVTDSVENTITYINTKPNIDLVFMDIQLADGLSFKIFSKVNIEAPIIFTTAYNQYALKAFKLNSIDYLLKPIDQKELERTFTKLETISRFNHSLKLLQSLEKSLKGKTYKERFLIKNKQGLSFLKTKDVQYLYSDSGLTFAKSSVNKRFNLEETLDKLELQLDPISFFRINRKMIININCIIEIQPYLNNRLILKVDPHFDDKIIVSRERVQNFKAWLDS